MIYMDETMFVCLSPRSKSAATNNDRLTRTVLQSGSPAPRLPDSIGCSLCKEKPCKVLMMGAASSLPPFTSLSILGHRRAPIFETLAPTHTRSSRGLKTVLSLSNISLYPPGTRDTHELGFRCCQETCSSLSCPFRTTCHFVPHRIILGPPIVWS